MSRSAPHPVLRISGGGRALRSDQLAVEEPLEIRLNGEPLAVTMRTPGHDFDLVAGFLLSEGVVAEPSDIASMRQCEGPGNTPDLGIVEVTLAAPGSATPARAFPVTAACGVCGRASIEDVVERAADMSADGVQVQASTLAGLPGVLREAQTEFKRTGGVHAAGLFSADGSGLVIREDVGRHNAFDKVIGRSMLDGRLPLSGRVILASGRAGFELVAKAAIAGIPVLAAVSAPSSLAVDLASRLGMTLVGFLRGDTMNVYCGQERVG